MHVLFIVLSILLIFVVVYLFVTKNNPNNKFVIPLTSSSDEQITFLSAKDTASFIMADPDTYTFNLSPLDLHARQAASYEEYEQASARSARSFTSPEIHMLTRAAKKADAIISKMNLSGCPTFAEKLVKIPWIFASTEGSTYEDGLPHTRANIIFLSSITLARLTTDEYELVKTLIHEKIHLHQRLYPNEVLALLKHRGYIQWKERKGVPRIRANPDLDPWIYVDPETKKEMAAYYTSDTPSSISDITLTTPTFEHPYEALAYELTSNL